MPSSRRLKVTIVFTALALVILYYISTAPSRTRNNPFYTSTRDALSHKDMQAAGSGGLAGDDQSVQARLKEAADKAKIAAEKKGAEFHGDQVKSKGEEINAKIKGTGEDGVARKNMHGGSEKVMSEAKDRVDRAIEKIEEERKNETPEEHKAEEELNYILKRSPIIIFSKSYCPFSKKAKSILLTKYKITPAPYVVELDEHAIGPGLQAQLEKITGRSTVPNVLVAGVSIGGGDDIEEMHNAGVLQDKIQKLTRKKVQIDPK